MKTNSSNGQLTAQISMQDHKKSGFDLSNNVLGTGKIGRIIPTRALHVMPGDTIKADSKVAVQFEPLAVPILANMDVKQEHFYVPYNVVWNNWDKFISGGEKMDYQGVVPNVTLDNLIAYYDEEFQTPFTFMESANEGSYGTEIFPSASASPDYTNTLKMFNYATQLFNQSLTSLSSTFQCKDLLKPQYKALEDIGNLPYGSINSASQEGAGVPYFLKLTSRSEYKEYFIDLMNGNKYLDTIRPALDRIFYRDSMVVLPTDEGMNFIQLMYEFIKPWFGLGSNLDYLNMNRISFTDYLYQVIKHLTTNLKNSGNGNTSVNMFPGAGHPGYWSNTPMSILHLRANYNVWYNNYRDILLEADAFEPYDGDTISFNEIFALLLPRQRCWQKDMFTTALDNPGTGNVAVPLNSHIAGADGVPPMVVSYQTFNGDNTINTSDINGNNIYEVEIGDTKYSVPSAFLKGVTSVNNLTSEDSVPYFSLYSLDAAQRAQKWLQKALFYGNRISDFYYMHFGVRFLDARLRLPELLTSSSELVKLDVVMNNTNITTEAGGEVYQSIAGDRAAYASAFDNGNSFDRFCEEHGVIMSYLTIMPQATYAYGMNRDYSRIDQFDFAFSEFATLGMDAVYNYEITNPAVSDYDSAFAHGIDVFGYQGKYYDYKAKHSEEHGELLDSQDMYTFSRKFNVYETYPKLNYEFVHCFPDLDMFVVDSPYADYFRYDVRHSTAAERNLPSQSLYI